jgi:hypothetical protein
VHWISSPLVKLYLQIKLCGLEESVEKSVKLSTRMEFLGVTVDTEKMTLEVTPDRSTFGYDNSIFLPR